MISKIKVFSFLFILFSGLSHIAYAQHFGMKTNTLLLGTASPNVGMELSMGKKFSLSIEGSYNPISFSKETFWKHWFIQPELRWWYCHRYAGSFWGVHGIYGDYNLSVPSLGIKNRYEGSVLGGGISYGYSWILDNRWNLETVIGGGYAALNYDKYECGECGEKLGTFKRNYLGVTRAAISLVYYF